MGKRELVALLNLSSRCLLMVEWLFLAVPWGCLWFLIVVFPDHTHLLFLGKRFEKFIFYYYNGAQKHEGFVGFENACSRAKTKVILTSLIYVYFYARCC